MDCTQAETEYAKDPNNHFTCLNRGETIGVLLSSTSGIFSACAVLWLFANVFHNVIKHRRKFKKWKLVTQPIEVYLLSLFTADLLQALGTATSLKWVHDGNVRTGSYCDAQGFLQTLGETGVGLTTLVISVYSFVVIWWGKKIRHLRYPYLIIGLLWAFLLLYSIILRFSSRERRQIFFTPTPYWCWVNFKYLRFQLTVEYIWLWLALLISLLCYIPLFLWKRGNIIIEPKFQFRWRLPQNARQDADNAFYMILYPVVYSILVTPISAVRWSQFTSNSKKAHPALSFTVFFIFGLSGIFNVILFFYTRKGLLLFPERSEDRDEIEMVEADAD